MAWRIHEHIVRGELFEIREDMLALIALIARLRGE